MSILSGMQGQLETKEDLVSQTVGSSCKTRLTVRQLTINMLTATDAEKENHGREAAVARIRDKPAIRVRDPFTGQESSYHIVLEDSPIWYVWDETRPIRITLVTIHVYGRNNPTTDNILQRPLRVSSWCQMGVTGHGICIHSRSSRTASALLP